MSKKKVLPNRFLVEERAKRIENCKQCNGAPPTKDCELQGLKFKACEYCLEVVGDYIKEGEAIKIKTKREIADHFQDPNYRKTTTIETIPGKIIDFNSLEID